MKKKIGKILGAISLMLFSFYYTNKSIDIVRNVDPIMKSIEENKDKFEIIPTDAKIENNTIIPGKKGKEVDKNKTYTTMKKYGAYNESLTKLQEVEPTVSVSNTYDKYIVKGNDTKKEVSLIFLIDSKEKLNTISIYLDKVEVPATFFIDDKLLDNVSEKLKVLSNYQKELLFSELSEINISTKSNYFNSITGESNKYCYTEEENEEILKVCKKFKMHTIIPTIKLQKNSINIIKKELTNGSIIAIDINNELKKDLDYIINYIKSKGYSFQRLDKLLEE